MEIEKSNPIEESTYLCEQCAVLPLRSVKLRAKRLMTPRAAVGPKRESQAIPQKWPKIPKIL